MSVIKLYMAPGEYFGLINDRLAAHPFRDSHREINAAAAAIPA